jgi:hypothetical protein
MFIKTVCYQSVLIFWNNNKKHGFDFKLDKKEYFAGEKIKGTLTHFSNEAITAKAISFKLVEIEREWSMSYQGESTTKSRSDQEFLLQDLSYYLKPIKITIISDGSLQIPKQGPVEMPFECLPIHMH